jgi:hypothetical protein
MREKDIIKDESTASSSHGTKSGRVNALTE